MIQAGQRPERPLVRVFLGGALLAGLVWASPAHAHSLSNRVGDFYGGILHPWTALEHALPFLALGLLAGQQGARAARWMLLVFPLGLLLGVAFAAMDPADYWVTPFNYLSFVVLGLLLAAAWHIPIALLLALGAVVGLSHGYENGRDLTMGPGVYLFAPGVALVGFIVTSLASALTLDLTARADWPRVAVRIAGSWIAAIGIMMIGLGWRPA